MTTTSTTDADDLQMAASGNVAERENAAELLDKLLEEAEASGVSDRTLDELLAAIRRGQLLAPRQMDRTPVIHEYNAYQAFLKTADQGKTEIETALHLLRRP